MKKFEDKKLENVEPNTLENVEPNTLENVKNIENKLSLITKYDYRHNLHTYIKNSSTHFLLYYEYGKIMYNFIAQVKILEFDTTTNTLNLLDLSKYDPTNPIGLTMMGEKIGIKELKDLSDQCFYQ